MSQRRLRLRVSSDPELTRTLVDVSSTARGLGFTDYEARSLVTCVSELGRNILKYAGSGEILIEEMTQEGRAGIEVTAQDRGPGIADLKVAMTDHFSSSGTLGLGLPGVKRMVDDFAIESTPGAGTKVVIRVWRGLMPTPQHGGRRAGAAHVSTSRAPKESAPAGTATQLDAPVECASCGRPKAGQRVSGDVALLDWRRDCLLIAIVDGVGHGAAAHQAALRAATYLRETWSTDVSATLFGLHASLHGTVGVVAGLGVLRTASGLLTFAGIGNTSLRVFGDRETRLESVAGILGHQIRTPKEHRLQLLPNETLLAYTDGIKDRFQYSEYPQIRYQNVRLVAEEIVARFGKDHDDATCAVVRYRG